MSEQKIANKTTTKTTVKKSASKKKTAVANKAAKKTVVEQNVIPTIQAVVEEMSKDRETRDKQISSLIEEVRHGFTTLSNKTSEQDKEHRKEMTGLYQTLQNVFSQIKDGSNKSEENNLTIFKNLSDSIMKDHEQTLIEVHEQEKLQDKKIKRIDKLQQQRSGRNRLIAIPGMIIAIIGIVYMFNVVNIMESAMTNMSQDMHKIQLSVGHMAGNMDTMSANTSAAQ